MGSPIVSVTVIEPAIESPAAAWLRDQLRRGTLLDWTGRGASFALAETFAATLRTLGSPSYAVAPSDAGRGAVCAVSRSGEALPGDVRLLVTERLTVPTGHPVVLPVTDPAANPAAWFPIDYLRAAVQAFARATGLGSVRAPRLVLESGYRHVLVVPGDARPVARLLDSAQDKLGLLGISAVGLQEVGHGFHSRLYASPNHYVVHGLLPAEASLAYAALDGWCRELGVGFRTVPTADVPQAARHLVGLLVGLDMIRDRCVAAGVDPSQRPMPKELDRLRGHGGAQ